MFVEKLQYNPDIWENGQDMCVYQTTMIMREYFHLIHYLIVNLSVL
jgi:hypothetical protein